MPFLRDWETLGFPTGRVSIRRWLQTVSDTPQQECPGQRRVLPGPMLPGPLLAEFGWGLGAQREGCVSHQSLLASGCDLGTRLRRQPMGGAVCALRPVLGNGNTCLPFLPPHGLLRRGLVGLVRVSLGGWGVEQSGRSLGLHDLPEFALPAPCSPWWVRGRGKCHSSLLSRYVLRPCLQQHAAALTHVPKLHTCTHAYSHRRTHVHNRINVSETEPLPSTWNVHWSILFCPVVLFP